MCGHTFMLFMIANLLSYPDDRFSGQKTKPPRRQERKDIRKGNRRKRERSREIRANNSFVVEVLAKGVPQKGIPGHPGFSAGAYLFSLGASSGI